VAYILSRDLTEDSEPGLQSLYRYEVDSDKLELIATLGVIIQFSQHEGFEIQVSADGETVYFESEKVLASGGRNGFSNFYVWRDNAVSLVASFDLDPYNNSSTVTAWASPNGRYLAFRAGTKLLDYNPSAPGKCIYNGTYDGDYSICRQAYRYDADTHTLSCASCPADGQPALGAAHFGYAEDEWVNEQLPRVVTNDGQVFFDTPNRLVPSDSNGSRDVYEYDGTNVRLISPGQGAPSELAAIGGDGHDIFFLTQNQLVKEDIDSALDVYDARIGGGFASQNGEVPSADCSADDCRGLPPAPPPPPPGGSETTVGPGSPSARKKQRCGREHRVRKVKGKQRCVNQHKSNSNRRQGR
jgi:hypothetical protein